MVGQVLLELNVELNDHEHGHRHGHGLEYHDPDMRILRAQRSFAVPSKDLAYDRHNGEKHTDEAVLKNASPDDLPQKSVSRLLASLSSSKTHIKPSQPTPRFPKRSANLPARTLLQPEHPQKPVHGLNPSKILLLLMQIRRDVVAQQAEETRNRKRLVAVAEHFEVHGFAVEDVAEEADDAVDGDHEEDPDDVFLLAGAQVVQGVHGDQVEGYYDADEAEDCAEEEAEVVEGEVVP